MREMLHNFALSLFVPCAFIFNKCPKARWFFGRRHSWSFHSANLGGPGDTLVCDKCNEVWRKYISMSTLLTRWRKEPEGTDYYNG